MAGNPCTREIIEALTGHLYDGNNSDIRLPAGELIGAFRRQGEAKIEGLLKAWVVQQPPYQRNRIQVADCADSRPGKVNGVQLPILALGTRVNGLAWPSTNGTWNDLVAMLSSRIRATSRVPPLGES